MFVLFMHLMQLLMTTVAGVSLHLRYDSELCQCVCQTQVLNLGHLCRRRGCQHVTMMHVFFCALVKLILVLVFRREERVFN